MIRSKQFLETDKNKYYIDTTGKVTSVLKSTCRVLNMKLIHNTHGYLTVSINSIKKTFKVHRLVAMAFIENPSNKPTVDHIDGNKTNNNVNNLRWMTYYENTLAGVSSKNTTKGVSKPITINNVVFNSITQAARHIAKKENKKVNTIKREIRRLVKGEREAWSMYNKYFINC